MTYSTLGRSFVLRLVATLIFVTAFTFFHSAHAGNFQKDTNGTLTTNLVAHYRLDETTTGATSTDSLFLRDLTNNNSVAFGGGLLGNAADGGSGNTTKYLNYDGDVGLGAATSSYSISLWMNPTDTLSSYPQDLWISLASAGGNSNDMGVMAINSSNGRKTILGFRNYNTGSGSYIVPATDPTLSTSTWNHVVYTYDGTIQNLYLNDVSIASGTETTAPNNGNSAGASMFHGVHTNSMDSLYFRGKIDEVGLWSKALSRQEIDDLYNNHGGDPLISPYISTSTLKQYRNDGSTQIDPGGTTPDNTAKFQATVGAASGTVELQVEVELAGTNFMNTPSATSTFATGTITVAVPNLLNRSYHWQARTLSSLGGYSPWQSYGATSTSVDFRVSSLANAASEYFDGSSSLTYSAASDTFAATDPFTIELWYRTPVTSTVQDFVDSRASNLLGYVIDRSIGSGIQFIMNCDTGYIDFNAATSLANNNGTPYDSNGIWHHVAITKNTGTTASAFNLYFDGALQSKDITGSSGPISGNCSTSSSTKSISFATDANSASNRFTGNLDEIRIWNREQSSSSIQTYWNREVTSTDSNLLGLWRFNATSTDLRTLNATSGQSGSPSFVSSTPFGHFLMNQNGYPTSVHNGQLLWYPSSTQYTSYMNTGSVTWNALGGVTIASTTSAASTSTVVVSDFNLVDISYLAQWTPNTATTSPKLKFNQYDIDQNNPSTSTIQQAAIHELGHALGLDHSYVGNVMYYTVNPGGPQIFLGDQDKIDYHFLWGGN